MIDETAGLVIHTADGKLPSDINYYMCGLRTKPHTLCPDTAQKLAKEGYKMEQIIAAYTTAYPGRKIECFNK